MSKTQLVKGDLVEYKPSFRAGWRPGWIVEVERHRVTLRDGYSSRRAVIEPGRRGKVRALSGAKMVDTLAALGPPARPKPAPLPPIHPIVVRTAGQPRAVPAPRARYRSGGYLAFVRTFPCLHCAAPACFNIGTLLGGHAGALHGRILPLHEKEASKPAQCYAAGHERSISDERSLGPNLLSRE